MAHWSGFDGQGRDKSRKGLRVGDVICHCEGACDFCHALSLAIFFEATIIYEIVASLLSQFVFYVSCREKCRD